MIKDYIKRRYGFLLFLLMLVLSRIFLWGIVSVSGDSMAPTFEEGQRLVAVNFSTISRFDVVTINSPLVANEIYLKRVIGLPGEKVEMVDDVLSINGETVTERFLLTYQLAFYHNKLRNIYEDDVNYQQIASEATSFTEDFSIEVPQGEFFLMGDNRLISMDSRSNQIGTVKKSAIRNEVKLVFWPFNKVRFHL